MDTRKSVAYWLPATLWASVIFVSSCFYIPSKQFIHGVVSAGSGHVEEGWFNGFWHHWWWLFVKGYHALEFAILTLLFIHALSCQLKLSTRALMAGVLSFLYACSDEWHQTFVKDRGGKWTDVAIDCIGILAVSAFVTFYSRLRNRRDQFAGAALTG